jgi:hypothetical protein
LKTFPTGIYSNFQNPEKKEIEKGVESELDFGFDPALYNP